jgi:hypothetical protein
VKLPIKHDFEAGKSTLHVTGSRAMVAGKSDLPIVAGLLINASMC